MDTIIGLLKVLAVLGGLGLLFGVALAFSAEFFHVEPDKRTDDVLNLLPGYNCGACGYPGCGGFAEGIMEGEVTNLSDCKPGKDEHYNAILAYLKDHPNPDGTLVSVKK